MITLSKLTPTRFLVITNLLDAYINHLEEKKLPTDQDHIFLSIAQELYYKNKPKIQKQHLPKTLSIKMLLHQAIVLQQAFSYAHTIYFETSETLAIVNTLNIELGNKI